MMITFLTLCFNGMPFIRHHLPVFQSLSLPWRWVIVEGLSVHGHDRNSPQPDISSLNHGDGTSAYLDSITDKRVQVVRRNDVWLGKTEMCNAALVHSLPGPGLIWQVDVDEYWTAPQIEKMAEMFEQNPQKTSAMFCCKYFVGPDRWIFEPGKTGNIMSYEWRRAWRYVHGAQFSRHEPPVYGGTQNDFTHEETMKAGLIFDHLAYVNEEQVRFKERYYGCPGMVDGWKRLQAASLPTYMRHYLPYFCHDDAKVVGA
jgi:hypothetical protein